MSSLLSRRAFLATMATLPWLPSSLFATVQDSLAVPSLKAVFVNGHIDVTSKHYISGFDASGAEKFRIALPDEAHGFSLDPQRPNRVVSAPSLPGTRAVVMDVRTGKQLAVIKSRPGRHYLGHASYSPDGRLLFTTENIIDTAEGVITVRDGHDYRFLRELPAYGIGPHDMAMLPDGKTLVVASGGIRTHPDSGRRDLNRNTMKSALLFIDSDNGELLMRREIPVHRLSIRHIDVGAEGEVLVACQYKGRLEMPKLVGVQRGSGEIEMLDIDDDELFTLRDYTACACIAPGGIGAVSCPRGNRLSLWDLRKKRLIKVIEINDVGGIEVSVDGNSFILSANVGELYQLDIKTLQLKALGGVWQNAKWTNHMLKTFV